MRIALTTALLSLSSFCSIGAADQLELQRHRSQAIDLSDRVLFDRAVRSYSDEFTASIAEWLLDEESTSVPLVRPSTPRPSLRPRTASPTSSTISTTTNSPTLTLDTVAPSPGPSVSCKDLPREQTILQLLSLYSPLELLMDSSTPQGQAFNWIVNNDTGAFQIDPCAAADNDELHPQQRFALAVVWFSTNGPTSWKTTDGWLNSDINECSWFGITCDDTTEKVTAIELGTFGNNVRCLCFFMVDYTLAHTLISL